MKNFRLKDLIPKQVYNSLYWSNKWVWFWYERLKTKKLKKIKKLKKDKILILENFLK